MLKIAIQANLKGRSVIKYILKGKRKLAYTLKELYSELLLARRFNPQPGGPGRFLLGPSTLSWDVPVIYRALESRPSSSLVCSITHTHCTSCPQRLRDRSLQGRESRICWQSWVRFLEPPTHLSENSRHPRSFKMTCRPQQPACPPRPVPTFNHLRRILTYREISLIDSFRNCTVK